MSRGRLRARAVLDEWFPFVVVALLILGAAGGWFTYATHVDPGTHPEERTVSSWETAGRIEHAATVRRANPVFPRGSTLRNRSAYFRRIAPVLDGAVRYRYAATERGNLTVGAELDLVLRAVSGEGGGGTERTEYWRIERPIGERMVVGVRPGETVTVPFSLNVTRIESRMTEVSSALGGMPGSTGAVVRIRFRLSGTVNGGRIGRAESYEVPIGIEGSTYRVAEPDGIGDRYERTRTVAVTDTYGPIRRIGAPLVLVLSLLGAGALAVARNRGEVALSDAEREYLRFRDDRDDFEEWIATVRLPEEVFSRPRAEAASLGDLVDVAIDTDNAVVEDPDTGAFYVVHGGYLWVYSPPEDAYGTPFAPGDGDVPSDAADE